VITRIEATQYRCFEKLDVDLGEFQVLVGANGSGKTTLLDIPVLLGDFLRERSLATAVLERRDGRAPRASSLKELFFQGQSDWFILAVEAELPQSIASQIAGDQGFSHLRYELRVQLFNDELQVDAEYLFAYGPARIPPRDEASGRRMYGEDAPPRKWRWRGWRFILKRASGSEARYLSEKSVSPKVRKAPVPPQQLALRVIQFGAVGEFTAARWFLDQIEKETVFLDPDWDRLRTASPPGLSKEHILPNAHNAPWLALALKKTDPDLFDRWKIHVRGALPQVTDIDVIERSDDHHAYFKVCYNEKYYVTSSGLSDGTLHIFVLTLLAYLPRTPRYLVAEQPEDGIHPRAIEAVMQGLESLVDGQTIVSSHSPVVVARTKPEALLVAQIADSGAVRVVSGRVHPRLLAWKGEIPLASLFATGILE
jgi:predicted ATPase